MSVKLENINIANTAGDGIHMTGGKVDAKNLVMSNIGRDGVHSRGGDLSIDGYRAESIGRHAIHVAESAVNDSNINKLRAALNIPATISNESIRSAITHSTAVTDPGQQTERMRSTGFGRWAAENCIPFASLMVAVGEYIK